MNRDQRMDELLRQKLGGHQAEPSPGVWEGLSGHLPGPSAPAWKLWLNTLILPITILLLTGGLYFYPFAGEGERTTEQANMSDKVEAMPEPTSQDEEYTAIAEAVTIAKGEQDLPAAPVQEPAFANTTKPASSILTANPENTPEKTKPPVIKEGTAVSLEDTDPPAEKNSVEPVAVETALPVVTPTKPKNPGIKHKAEPRDAAKALNIPSEPSPSADLPAQTGASPEPLNVPPTIMLREKEKPDIRRRNSLDQPGKRMDLFNKRQSIRPVWSLGVYFVPEIYNSEGEYAEKTLFGFDGLMRYTWYNYTLEAGIGLGRVRNENLYTVDYNAYLGTYQDLDSIAFKVDTASQTIVPEYFFNEVEVYDSTTSSYFKRSVNKYTYLQFPLFIGYRHPMGRLSLTMRGGPMLSVMVGSKEPEVYIDDETNRIIQIKDRTPGRLTTNWQFLLNAGISYQLTSKLSLSLEPGIRFYLDPIYQGEATKPWSVNIRSGIIYEFK